MKFQSYLFLTVFAIVFPNATFAQEQNFQVCLDIHPQQEAQKSKISCAAALKEGVSSVPDRAEVLLNLGLAERALGNLAASEDALMEAAKLSPKDTNTLRMLAWTSREAGKLEQAEQMYTQVLELDDHWQGWLSRCVVRQDLGKYLASIRDCKRALDQEPDMLDALYFHARGSNEIEQYQQALVSAQKGLVENDIGGRLYFEAAYAEWYLGRHMEARQTAQDGLGRYPDDPDLKRFLQQTQ